MPASPKLYLIPRFRHSPDAPLPKFKALIIGINYTSSQDELQGPVNDAKDIKKALEGEA